MQSIKWLTGIVIAGMLMAVIIGCGSSSGVSTPGTSAVVTIQWPPQAAAAARVMPAGMQSVKVELSDGAGFTAAQTADRPASGNTSTLTFMNVPVGTLTVTATAYPQTGGAGTPQAMGSTQLTTVAGQQASCNLTMASTIDHLDITSASLSVPVGSTLLLTATPKDASGNTVMVPAANITWSSAAPNTASVNIGSGVVTGVAAGTAVITATESDSGKSASVTITVTAVNTAPTASFTITPASGTTATNFAFDASASSDAQDAASALQVHWDWNNSGVWTAYTTTKTATHTFATAGTYTVTLQVKDSGGLTSTITHTVVVSPLPVTVTVSPATATISVGKTATFTAAVANTANTAVTWSVVEAGGGSVNANGVYTAPATAGTYHVKATSVADATKSDQATVTVQSSGVVVIVN